MRLRLDRPRRAAYVSLGAVTARPGSGMAQDSEVVRRGRGRPREFDRTQAVDSAMRLFWERGFEGTSIEDLIETMNVSPSSFYSAFGSKKNLYREAMDYYAQGPGGFIGEV